MVEKQEVNAYLIAVYHSVLIEKSVLDLLTKRLKMADITDIKSILYTEKTIELQENGVIVLQTSPRMTKTGLKRGFQKSILE